MTVTHEWPYFVKAFYADDVLPPKRPGKLAIETRHRTEASAQMEVRTARSRVDIGEVVANVSTGSRILGGA